MTFDGHGHQNQRIGRVARSLPRPAKAHGLLGAAQVGSKGGPIGRTAPSATGLAHPGTWLSALLAWLDIRQLGGQIHLRLEDLDPQRSRRALVSSLVDDMAWLGLSFDATVIQSDRHHDHHRALAQLAAQGDLYACSCSRSDVAALARLSPTGGWAYDNRCRSSGLVGPDDWADSALPLRAKLPDEVIYPPTVGGPPLMQNPARAVGDPIVRRKDKAVAYALAVVVDDAAAGVTRVVRGRDLAPYTATQVALLKLLGLAPPVYAHHLLLYETAGQKLAKLHGSMPSSELKTTLTADALLGTLAYAAGLLPEPEPVDAQALVGLLHWPDLTSDDRTIVYQHGQLQVLPLASRSA